MKCVQIQLVEVYVGMISVVEGWGEILIQGQNRTAARQGTEVNVL